MHTFDYSFLKDPAVTSAFETRLDRIEGFRSKVERFVINNPGIAGDMAKLSRIVSTKESNSLEGISTDDSRLVGLLISGLKPAASDEYELIGYSYALDRVHDHQDVMGVDEDAIKSLYSVMVSYSGDIGGYKKKNNEIVDRDENGKVVRKHKVVPASQVDDCMSKLMEAFWKARDDPDVSDILLLPCFILDFLRIHPFMYRNGRMSRLLTILLMYQQGLDVCAYVPIEAIINHSKRDYYDALERSSERWFDNKNDYLPFMDYMIGVIFLAYREFDRLTAPCIGRDTKENRLERVITGLCLPISKRELCSLMPDVSETYIELLLNRLLKDGKIRKIGSRKASRYVLAE